MGLGGFHKMPAHLQYAHVLATCIGCMSHDECNSVTCNILCKNRERGHKICGRLFCCCVDSVLL